MGVVRDRAHLYGFWRFLAAAVVIPAQGKSSAATRDNAWMQAIGRLRCLVNGCCHGRETSPALGIRVSHDRSRVTRMAELAGIPIHATQLYSILTNGFLGLFLLRLWMSGCPTAMICGIYGIGNGLARFAEEAYRGEPQTAVIFGLRLYQWFAIASVCVGAVLTVLDSPQPPAFRECPGWCR